MTQEAARIQVDLTVEAAGMGPLAAIDATAGDLTPMPPLLALLASPVERSLELRLPGVPETAAVARHAVRDLVTGNSDIAGLLLLDVLARAWGVQPEPGGKCGWFELELDPG